MKSQFLGRASGAAARAMVLIGTRQATSDTQHSDAQVTVSAYIKPVPPEGFPMPTVYFEVTDPDDLSHYEGKTNDAPASVQGDIRPNDNVDPEKRMGWDGDSPTGYAAYQANCLSARSATAALETINGTRRCVAETTLSITQR